MKSKISILAQHLALPAVVFFGAFAGPVAALLIVNSACRVLARCGGL